MKGALQDRTKKRKWGGFVDIESTINYSSCLEPSLCMGKRGSTYAWKRVNGPKRDGIKPKRKNGGSSTPSLGSQLYP